MGLDMYVHVTPVSNLKDKDALVDLSFKDQNLVFDLDQFRKFNHLHGWMERLYYSRGGKEEPFNCASVRLTADDMEMLRLDWEDKALPARDGFFFGSGEWDSEFDWAIQDLIYKVTRELKRGHCVYYTSWW